MPATLNDVRVLSILLCLDLLCLLVTSGDHWRMPEIKPCYAFENCREVRIPPSDELTAMLDDMKLHD